MNWLSKDGSPYVGINDVTGITYSFDGSPYWYASSASTPPTPVTGHIKRINGVSWANVKKYNTVSKANIDKAMGVSS